MKINWYPGHMVRAKNILRNYLPYVDLVLEVTDARIPATSRNSDIESMLNHKPFIIVLNKSELAEEEQTRAWVAYWLKQGLTAIAVDSLSSIGVKKVIKACRQIARKRVLKEGRKQRPFRAMVVGIPNVGKSTFINSLTKRAPARTGEKPGITRGTQWIKIAQEIELLDTPGLLTPKVLNAEIAFKLAVTGTVSEAVYEEEDLALNLLRWLSERAPEAFKKRYGFQLDKKCLECALENIGQKRGLLLPGGKVDIKKSAASLIYDFRKGKLGRFTLDRIIETN